MNIRDTPSWILKINDECSRLDRHATDAIKRVLKTHTYFCHSVLDISKFIVPCMQNIKPSLQVLTLFENFNE